MIHSSETGTLDFAQALSVGNRIHEDMKFDLISGALPDLWHTFVSTDGNNDTLNMKNMLLEMKRKRYED